VANIAIDAERHVTFVTSETLLKREHTNVTYQHISNALSAIPITSACCITTHRHPDGDAIGSALAVWHALRLRGVLARVVLPTAPPRNLLWLPGAEHIETYGSEEHATYLHDVDTVIILDLNAVSRFAPISDHVMRPTCTRILVDHHIEPEHIAQHMLVDVTSPATCAMLVTVLQTLTPSGLSPDIAQCLYTGIYTDTGGFRFPRTDGNLFRSVADLVDAGADPVVTHERLYNQVPFCRMALLGKALASMRLEHDGSTALMVVTQEDIKQYHATTEDLDGFVHHTLSIEGVDAGILIADLGDQIKVSFRSKGAVYVRDIAAEFGGGGHLYAAGARLSGIPLNEAVERVIEAIGCYRAKAFTMRSTP
jgi:phosphoesterase RecJ-like protein